MFLVFNPNQQNNLKKDHYKNNKNLVAKNFNLTNQKKNKMNNNYLQKLVRNRRIIKHQ